MELWSLQQMMTIVFRVPFLPSLKQHIIKHKKIGADAVVDDDDYDWVDTLPPKVLLALCWRME